MPVLFDLIAAEPHPGVRAVLGHFFFVYIHPYMDGNGRLQKVACWRPEGRRAEVRRLRSLTSANMRLSAISHQKRVTNCMT
jgi:hypothetical protein